MDAGDLTSEELTTCYLSRIAELDVGGLQSMNELDPDALDVAAALDEERAAGNVRGLLRGIPISLKDNIGTGDRMHNTAGVAALVDARSDRDSFVAGGRLSRGYWLAWWLIVLGVSVEFSLVFWASTLVERQVGIPLADATLVAASFYAGMATSRVALSFHVVSSRDPVWMMRAGLLVALLGSLLAWATQDVVPAGLGIYLGGLGTGFLYPLGVAVALALAPGLQDRGSVRLVLASGVAILVAPFVLGLAADAAGVSFAWLLVPALCVAALGLSVPIGRSRPS